MKKITYLSFALASMLLVSACSKSDEAIQKEVSGAIASEPAFSGVKYEVKDGVLTVSGEVESEEQKAQIVEKLKGLEGVKSVVDNLTVKPVEVPIVEAPSADTELSILVSNAISATGVPGIAATVQDSVVSLTGTVARADLKKIMAAVMGVGPKKVENKLEITK